jgi:hypothetical protein
MLDGCDKSDAFPDCTVPSDPSATRRIDACPSSFFDTTTIPAWRDVSGQVWRGEIGVEGAVVRVSPVVAPAPAALVATTGPEGFFGPVHDVDLRYDVTVRAAPDILRLQGLTLRNVAPAFDGPHDRAAGYSKILLPQIDPPVAADHTIAFYATGTTAFGIAGDLEHGLTLVDSAYEASATIHAVEYVRGKDFLSATAYGNAQIVATAAAPELVSIHLAPVTTYIEHTLDVTPPGGSKTSAELLLVFSRSSLARSANAPLGTKIQLPILPGSTAGFAYHIVATAPDGTVLDSAEKFISSDPVENVSLSKAPELVAPADGASIDATATLSVSGSGLFVHAFRPSDGSAGTIRVVTSNATTTLPDFAAVGAAPPKGAYVWTVRAFPGLTFPENFTGIDAGRYDASATSKPRTVVLR